MIISGFLNYDEALQYARQLYADDAMNESVKGCRSIIISEKNLAFLGTRISYDEYQQFYEETFIPLKISEEQLLIVPEGVQVLDAEEFGEPQEEAGEENDESNEDEDELFPQNRPQQKVEDFDFGDDFW